jgi:hypothetical protein
MDTENIKHKDLPREELMKSATEAIANCPGAEVYFKFTCAHCGERCILLEPNKLYERGECHKCGQETVIDEGGYMLSFKLEG